MAPLTGRENAELLGVLAGMSVRESKRAIPNVEAASGLGRSFERPVSSYSQGMRARLGFATADEANPAILLLDEVHEALDHEYRALVQERARQILAAGGIVVAAGHDHPLLEQLSSRALWLDGGQIVADGPFETVRGSAYLAQSCPREPAPERARPRPPRRRLTTGEPDTIVAMAAVADNTTIPWDWYVDPSVARLEQQADLPSHLAVRRATRVTWPSRARSSTTRAGDVPVVLVRGRDAVLRAFVNVCRHRGFTLCEGSGRRETLQCPYHAWTYDLDGSLRNAPRADSRARLRP